jgi:hypothetical protein
MEAARSLGLDFDTRSKREVVEDLRRSGVDAVPSLFPQGLVARQSDGTLKSLININGAEILPLAGISNKLAVVCNEGGQFVSHRSDRHGFNNPPQVWDLATVDVVAVGDSFAQVWCVPNEKHLVSLIRDRYPATLNLGMEGNGPLTVLATIKEYAQTVKPKVVLWFYCEGNDLADLDAEQRTPILMRYLLSGFSQQLSARQAEIDHSLTEFMETAGEGNNEVLVKLRQMRQLLSDTEQVPRLAGGIARLTQMRQRLGLVDGMRNESFVPAGFNPEERDHRMAPLIDLLQRILSEARSTVGEWGGTLYFVYLPTWHRYAPGMAGNPDRDAVLKAAGQVGLPIIDIHEIFAAESDPLNLFPLRLQGHYTEEGNRFVAETVLRSVSLER